MARSGRERESSSNRAMPSRNSRYVIATGFMLGLGLMIAISAIGLSRMTAINGKINAIGNVDSVKTAILTSMQNVVSSRSLSMYAMSLMDDPFEIDHEFQHFNHLAVQFIQLRTRLRRIGLSKAEEALLRDALDLIRRSAPLQEEIVDRIREGKLRGVRSLMLHQDLPLEKKIWARFEQIVALEHKTTRKALAAADSQYRNTYIWMVVLGMMTVVFGAVITRGVVRRTSAIEADLEREKEQAEVTLHAIGEGVITTDDVGCVRYLNPIAEQLTGWSTAEAKGRRLDEVYRVVDGATRRPIDVTGTQHQPDSAADPEDYPLLLGRTGQEFAVEDSVSSIRSGNGAVLGTVLVFRDVTTSRHLAAQLSWQASHDALTGLVNRRQFEQLLEEMLQSARTMDKVHAVLYVDLDQFKVVNDSCGHVAGDELLKQLAVLLEGHIRDSDTLARLGGDEFGVLLDGCSVERAETIAHELLEIIRNFHFVWERRGFRVGASIGVVGIDRSSGSLGRVLSAADAACYVAKDKGRNRVWVHEPQDIEIAQRRGEMEQISRITEAFENNRFVLYKQAICPLVEEAPGQGTHYELLIRMLDADGAVVPPMTFLPAAERYGIMPNIDRWVIRTAFRRLAQCPERYGADVRIAINLSAQTLNDDYFLEFVVDQFASSGLDASRIGFEITETTAIANWVKATHFISTLKAMGCRFALDDFGSGMSSFSYLKNLAVDFIKIDGMFVKDIVDDPLDYVMVEAIHHVGQVMGIRTIAEFVENDVILEKLREVGVDYVQGYGIHEPEPF